MGCERMWSCVHVMWSVAYVACGAAQLVAGIFFILGVPSWVLGCNLLTGSYNILMGIGVGMVACCGQVTPRRQETLLYMTVSILMTNIANIVVSEYGFYHVHITKLMEDHQYNELIKYACFGTRGTAALILLISFLDSQLAFCSMQSAAVARNATKKQPKNLYYHHHRGAPGALGVTAGSHEQVSDIEYIIPRQKSSSKSPQQAQQAHQVYNAYSQSWVFDADSNNTTTTLVNPNGSLGSGGSRDRSHHPKNQYPHQHQHQYHHQQHQQHQQQHYPLTSYQQPPAQYYDGIAHVTHTHGDVVRGKQLMKGLDCGLVVTDSRRVKGLLIDNPNPVVQVADASPSDNNDRKLGAHMKSFSRSASPAVLSACSSQLSLNNHNVRIKQEVPPLPPPLPKNQEAASEEVVGGIMHSSPHACLMKELQKAIVNKAATTSSSRQESASLTSSSKNSDAEFSKELEAALQLIQDLESPNTIDTTPSDHPNGDGDDDSEKTLSASGSLAELQAATVSTNGKGTTRIFVPNQISTAATKPPNRSGGSQSTSGYSSPTRGQKSNVWSTTSSMNGSSQDVTVSQPQPQSQTQSQSHPPHSPPPPLTYTIHNTHSTAVISLFSPATKQKSITLVNITGPNSMHDNTSSLSLSTVSDASAKTVGGGGGSSSSSSKHLRTESSASSSASSGGGAAANVWSVRSLLRKKRTTPPKLCPELEEAIVKSESLAYLSELELVARHERNASIQRQIEQKVHQQLSIPRTSSNC